MNRRRRRRYRIHIRILRGDALVVALLMGAAVAACLHWPERTVADIAIPVAGLVAFVTWRHGRA
jgi:hypothetical protein